MISLLNFCLIRLDPNKTHSICLHVNLVFENVRTIIIIKPQYKTIRRSVPQIKLKNEYYNDILTIKSLNFLAMMLRQKCIEES